MDEYVVADTTVLSFLSKASPQCTAYMALLGELRLAINFQTQAELLSADYSYSPRRKAALEALVASALKLPHSEATGVWYARVATMRKELKSPQSNNASDADIWIISSALEYRLALITGDRSMVILARMMGVPVLTALPDLTGENPTLG